MSHWRNVAPGIWGEHLRVGLLAAIEQVYDENCQRFAPEDIGDNNKTFGITISENLHYVIERDVVPLIEGAQVEKPRNAWVLRLPGNLLLHIYKAPPGAVDVREVRFNASKVKLELLTENAAQLALVFEEPELQMPGNPDLKHVVVVHFGDPHEGLQRVDVGAPYADEVNGWEWEWVDCLSELKPYDAEQEDGDVASDAMVDEDFGLEMREDAEEDGRQDSANES
jgi:hypothetical protein